VAEKGHTSLATRIGTFELPILRHQTVDPSS